MQGGTPAAGPTKKARLLMMAGAAASPTAGGAGGGVTAAPLDKKARLLAKFALDEAADEEPSLPPTAFAVRFSHDACC